MLVGLVAGYLTLSVRHEDTLLTRSRALAAENHEILLAIQKATGPEAQRTQAQVAQSIVDEIVNQTDCRVRDDVADIVRSTFPRIVVALPATKTCPAYSPA